MPNPSREDRITGCLLGGALGDAIGAHFEGRSSPEHFFVPSDLRVTDDTQLTIATCESIIDSRNIDPANVATHFANWFRDRRITGIGSSTLKSLTDLDAGGHWAMSGATGERSAGNGAAMRIAPLAFFLDPHIDTERQTIRDIARITHRNDEAYIGALAIVRSIRHVIDGNLLNTELVGLLVDSLPDSNVRDRIIVIRDSSIEVAQFAQQYGSSGYVADAVPLAILAAIKSTDILGTFGDIVRCGGDTDTIASMFGQIYGAAYGVGELPMEYVNQIDAVSLVRKTATNLAEISTMN